MLILLLAASLVSHAHFLCILDAPYRPPPLLAPGSPSVMQDKSGWDRALRGAMKHYVL